MYELDKNTVYLLYNIKKCDLENYIYVYIYIYRLLQKIKTRLHDKSKKRNNKKKRSQIKQKILVENIRKKFLK